MSIINQDIDLYTAFVEEEKRKLQSCHIDEEPRHKFLIKKYNDVLDALLELKSALYFKKSTT